MKLIARATGSSWICRTADETSGRSTSSDPQLHDLMLAVFDVARSRAAAHEGFFQIMDELRTKPGTS